MRVVYPTLIGEMHLKGVTAKELAEEAGWNPKYLSVVLNGHKTPKKAEQTLKTALNRIEVKRGLGKAPYEEIHTLEDLVAFYDVRDHEYATRLSAALGLSPAVSG